jgi:hypothetical protein
LCACASYILKFQGRYLHCYVWKKYVFITRPTNMYLSHNVVLQWFKDGWPYLVLSQYREWVGGFHKIQLRSHVIFFISFKNTNMASPANFQAT